MWSSFKTTIFDVASGFVGTRRRVKKNFVSQETLDTIDQSRRARLDGIAELFRQLRHKTVRVLREDKKAYVRGICEGVEHHLWTSDSHPAYREIRAETLDILLRALKVLNEESEPLGLLVSWNKTKIQVFNILDADILSVPVCGEDVEVIERFT